MQSVIFKSKDEELKFLYKILDNIPASINVSQLDNMNDPKSNINLWANRKFYNFFNYSGKEFKEIGFDFFRETMHPEDLELVDFSVNKLRNDSHTVYGGVMRLKPKNGEYHWFIGSIAVMEMKDDKPWRLIAIIQNMEEVQDTNTQIIQLIKENLRLKNQLHLHLLTKREKQIVKMIAKGNTDREIAKILTISPATVKTHRHNIIQKLHLKNKASIAQFAAENGLD